MELIHLSTITKEERDAYFTRLTDATITDGLRYKALEMLFFKTYAKNLNLHFNNEQNLNRFCLFAGLDLKNIKDGELLKEFFKLVMTIVVHLLKVNPDLLLKDKSLSYVANLSSTINMIHQYFNNSQDSECSVCLSYYLLKETNDSTGSLHQYYASGPHSTLNNSLKNHNGARNVKTHIIFFQDIISTILHWFKIDGAVFDESKIEDLVISLKESNTDPFYSRIYYYFKKIKKDPTFTISKPKNILTIDANIEKKKPTIKAIVQSKKKIKMTTEDLEYLAFLLVSFASSRINSFDEFRQTLFHFSAHKNMPHTSLLDNIFDILVASFSGSLSTTSSLIQFANPNTCGAGELTHNQEKILWFLNKFDILPSIDKISKISHRAFPANPAYITQIKKLSPLKKPNELKKIVAKLVFIEYFIIEKGYEYLLSNLRDLIFPLHELGLPVKTLTGFYSKFCDINLYLSLVELENRKIPYLNTKLVHDILWFFDSLTKMLAFNTGTILSENQLKTLKVLFKIGSSYNIDENSLHHLNSVFNVVLGHKEKKFVLLEYLADKKITSLKNLNESVETYNLVKEQARLEFLTSSNLLSIDDERLSYAKKEMKSSNFLDLLESLSSNTSQLETFQEKSNFIGCEVVVGDYFIGIYDHHHYAGFSGALARGVCIPSYGNYRLEQLNKNFLNLVVHNQDRGILLWGLLVGAVDVNNRIWFVLNNLQGSINDNRVDTRLLMESIIGLLRKLCLINNIVDGIIINDTGFNALRISEFLQISINQKENDEFFDVHKIKLIQNTRLDFSIDKDLLVNQHSHYGTLFPLPLA